MSEHLKLRLRRISTALQAHAYTFYSEAKLHRAISEVLTDAGEAHEMEYRLDQRHRADFWLAGIVIEVKQDGSVGDALRQVERYAEFPQVQAVILAACTPWARSVQLEAVAGKPASVVWLRRSAL